MSEKPKPRQRAIGAGQDADAEADAPSNTQVTPASTSQYRNAQTESIVQTLLSAPYQTNQSSVRSRLVSQLLEPLRQAQTPQDSLQPIAIATLNKPEETQQLRTTTPLNKYPRSQNPRAKSNQSGLFQTLVRASRKRSPSSIQKPNPALNQQVLPSRMKTNQDTLLQFAVSDQQLEERLQLVRAFSKNQIQLSDYILQNCANLTLVLLGLIQNPKKYLQVCTRRSKATQFTEISRTIKNTNEGCLLEEVEIPFHFYRRNGQSISYDRAITEYIGPELKPGYATLIHFQYGTHNHCILVRKTSGNEIVELIDAQDVATDGTYPFRQNLTHGAGSLQFSPGPNIKGIKYYIGPAYDKVYNPSAIVECLAEQEVFSDNVPEVIKALYSKPTAAARNQTTQKANSNANTNTRKNNKNKNKSKNKNKTNPNNTTKNKDMNFTTNSTRP